AWTRLREPAPGAVARAVQQPCAGRRQRDHVGARPVQRVWPRSIRPGAQCAARRPRGGTGLGVTGLSMMRQYGALDEASVLTHPAGGVARLVDRLDETAAGAEVPHQAGPA